MFLRIFTQVKYRIKGYLFKSDVMCLKRITLLSHAVYD